MDTEPKVCWLTPVGWICAYGAAAFVAVLLLPVLQRELKRLTR